LFEIESSGFAQNVRCIKKLLMTALPDNIKTLKERQRPSSSGTGGNEYQTGIEQAGKKLKVIRAILFRFTDEDQT
jgi:hypothetical protein